MTLPALKRCARLLAPVCLVGLLLGAAGCNQSVPGAQGTADTASAQIDSHFSPHVPVLYPSTDAVFAWREWNAATIAEAKSLGRPFLFYIATSGADGLLSVDDELVRSLAEERFIPIHIDPWLHPEIDRRYGGSWPTLSIVLPDGALVAQAPDISPERVRVFLLRILAHLQDRPEIVKKKIADAAVSDRSPIDAERVLAAATATFDAVHGGFGDGPKHPEAELLRFLSIYSQRHPGSAAGPMLRRTLDAILASDLWNRNTGPFVYAHTASWKLPRTEVDAAIVAGLVRVLQSLPGSRLSDRHALRQLQDVIAKNLYDEQLRSFVSRRLSLDHGNWWSDPTLYADRIAYLTWALYEVDAPISADLQQMRRAAAATLASMVDETGVVEHARRATGPVGARGLLRDQLLVSLALEEAARIERHDEWSRVAERTWLWARESLYDAEIGAFHDCLAPVGLIDWPTHMPFADDALPAGNSLAARLLLRHGEADQARQLLLRAPKPPSLRAHASAAVVYLQIEDGA